MSLKREGETEGGPEGGGEGGAPTRLRAMSFDVLKEIVRLLRSLCPGAKIVARRCHFSVTSSFSSSYR